MLFLFKKEILQFYWIGLSILILLMNLNWGPYVDFPVLFIIPVVLASWFNGIVLGLILAIGMPVMRLVFSLNIWEVPWSAEFSVINAAIRIFVLSIFAILIYTLHKQHERILVLEGLLPICHRCKKIRTSDNKWQSIEIYLNENAGMVFLQGVCDDCRANAAKVLS